MQGHRVLIYSQMTRMIDLLEVSWFACLLVMLIHHAPPIQSLGKIPRKQFFYDIAYGSGVFLLRTLENLFRFFAFFCRAVSSKVRIIILKWV